MEVFVDIFHFLAYNSIKVIFMAPEGYELIEYKIHNTMAWVLKDSNGEIWFPLSDIFKVIFKVSFNVTLINKKQAKHTIRLRMVSPRQNLRQVSKENQPKMVQIFGDLWCIKNLIRNKIILNQDPELKGRDILVEEFARYWGFQVIGFGVLTHRKPMLANYPFIDQIAIAGEINKETWLKCVECEKYYPYTANFYRKNNVTCSKCLGYGFEIRSKGAYKRINELLKKGKRD